MSGPPSNTVSASLYLQLAPSYALAPPAAGPSAASSSAPPPASKSRPPPPISSGKELRPYTQDEARQLVLDYLCHSGYLDSAKAFAKELSEVEDSSTKVKQEGKEGGPRASAHAERTRTNGDAMEGVEATPPPDFGEEASSAAGVEALREVANRDRVSSASNGKTVAFTGDGLDGLAEEDDEDCSLLSKEEVRDVRLRRTIREAILTGRINYAIDLLKENYPTVLPSSSSTASAPAAPSFSESESFTKTVSCTPYSFFVTSPAASTSRAPTSLVAGSGRATPIMRPATPSYIAVTGANIGPHALSLEPAILSLNLQTQALIEKMREYHASSASAPSTPTSSVHNGHTPRHHTSNGDDVGSDAGMSASTSSITSSLVPQIIAQSQALREMVLQLPPGKQREAWLKENIDMSALLAYKDLSGAPVRGYLAQERRETLAEMVNAAIMQQTNRTPLPLLALAARQTTAMWNTLRDMHVQFPPKPAGQTKEKARPTAARTYPTFDLHTFLNERDPPPAAFGSSSTIMQTE
ncbi:hypothetical protein JCM11251_004374 [Rhodosporidiobolus azoricus]